MKRKIFVIIVLIILLQMLIPLMKVSAVEKTKEEILGSMTTEEKIAQMLMPAFRTYNGSNVTSINEKIEDILAKRGFAGVILFGQNNTSTEQTVTLIDSMQKANIKNEDRPQLLVSVDQEGAGVARLAQGIKGPGNMALGATGDSKNAYDIAEIMGEELNALGYNVDFAPVVDVNNNPSNPVIGVRSFSDDANTVAEFGSEFMQGLMSKNIIPALKHFPGHGDTNTDSHTGLPRIEKSLDQLKQNEFIPFEKCIEDGAEMIMTAHIQYPQIETQTYPSINPELVEDNQIEIPATLSKKIITDILRDELGYDGVVITDAFDMDAIAKNFDRLDAAKLAINAGVDIILIPFPTTDDATIDELDQYITDVATLVDNGQISLENVNKAVLRILTLKENHDLLKTYSNTNLQSTIDNAESNVGTKDHHDKEWEIAKKSITLVKNDNNYLPIQNNEKTVILVRWGDEVLSGEYAISKLKEDNLIPDNMDISVYNIRNKELSEVQEIVKDAKNVILVTEQSNEGKLAQDIYTIVDDIADYVHEQGNKLVCVSCILPYDTARIQKADAILCAYSATGMDVFPDFDNGSVMAYGVSMPCGIYTAFDKNAKLGSLPVNVPNLNSLYKYADGYLYNRGYGLQYVVNDDVPTEEIIEQEETETSNPKTGDNILVWTSLAVISILGAAVVLEHKKK